MMRSASTGLLSTSRGIRVEVVSGCEVIEDRECYNHCLLNSTAFVFYLIARKGENFLIGNESSL